MRKTFRFSSVQQSITSTALLVALGACSSSTAPDARVATGNSIASRSTRGGSAPVAVFVIGDRQANDIGATVNFWGAQWWKNNQMSDTVTAGVASFKGYATTAEQFCGGTWQSRPGNSDDPPASIGADIVVVVTSTVIKDGASIRGDIKRVLMVHQDGSYGPNPGHDGNGVVTSVVCDGRGVET